MVHAATGVRWFFANGEVAFVALLAGLVVLCLSCFCVYGGEMGKKRGREKVRREKVRRERK